MTTETPSILVFGSRLQSEGYPRNRELVEAMVDAKWKLRWCALPYPAFYHRLNLSYRLGFVVVFTPVRWVYSLAVGVLQRLRGRASHVYVPFPALLDLPPAWLVARLSGARLVADVFLGTYNTLVEDRQLASPDSLVAHAIFHAEKLLLRLPDMGLVDTREHKALFESLFGVETMRLAVVPIAVDSQQFTFAEPARSDKVIFWGTYIKLHGVETIIRAASSLARQESEIRFEMIGTGQELKRAKQLAKALRIENIDFIEDIVPMNAIVARARDAFAALGIFGETAKSASVFPYKAVQTMALGLPLVTARTPASEQILVDGRDALLVNPGDAESLADALKRLHCDRELALSLSRHGREAYERNFNRDSVIAALQAAFVNKDSACTTRS